MDAVCGSAACFNGRAMDSPKGVNLYADMSDELKEIPGVDSRWETCLKIRALVVGGRNPVEAALARWQREHPKDFKAIMKVMKMAAGSASRLTSPKHVKKSSDKSHGDVYEMIAYTGVARLMFFYDEADQSGIICTNEHQKSQGDQGAAFLLSARLRDYYLGKRNTK